MSKGKILHVLVPDEFTIPYMGFINKEFDQNEHEFLSIVDPSEEIRKSIPNLKWLRSPLRKNFSRNTFIIYKRFKEATKVIMHGNPVLFYFFLFPFVLKKTYWVIYGLELPLSNSEYKTNISFYMHLLIKKAVLKRVYGHITHIKGDSDFANKIFKSKAKYFQSPMYLSNVVEEDNKSITRNNKIQNILIGNSASRSNCHHEIFQFILPFYKMENLKLYCPLSYGMNNIYKSEILKTGKNLFGDNFIPILDFMPIDEYKNFLGIIDIALFNHKRQEAMGVTLTLLAKEKIVYMNSETTSFKALSEKGIKVFDINLIHQDGLLFPRDVSSNPAIVAKYYSYENLKESFKLIFGK
jgi:hypothetical protein